ncbi:hypothetical protein Lalb_Chr24g0400041 [Lupinus albus]|uniref:Uncharacterized protein n=1 Tax=Lupinus albus TaxID=3870 RepID=A0A6A4N9D1_LUPAL|nr:hypothetical protein Lalb_Chr24g0400041 [Lupinus albus]
MLGMQFSSRRKPLRSLYPPKNEYSMQLNAIKVLQDQDDTVNNMKDVAAKELLNVRRDRSVYRDLLKRPFEGSHCSS